MKTMRAGWIAGAGLILGCATAAPPPQASSAAPPSTQKEAAAATAAASPDPAKTLICERVQVTGSHIPKRVCRTAQQIEEERENAQKMLRESERVNRRLGE